MTTDALTLEQVMAMPIDRLGMEILDDLVQRRVWHWGNSVIEFTQLHGLRSGSPEVGHFIEAWEWVLRNGLARWNPTQSAERAVEVSEHGRAVAKRGLSYARAITNLGRDLVPALERVRTQFLLGEFELGAFAAMREVEIAVRAAGRLPDALLGVPLMRRAFGDEGPLRDPDMEGGEAQAQANLFAGAIGLFKNPASHRRVDYTDPIQASEVVLLADLLLRLLATIAPGEKE